MSMTHYMSLLAENQPWNLIIFMAIPVILAETITISEFFIIFNRLKSGTLRTLNKCASIFLGFYFLGIFLYLFVNAVIPLTTTGGWLTWVDVVAVGFYLSGVLFLFPLALLDLGVIAKHKSDDERMRLHFILIGGFLVVAHVAMIFGMVDPSIAGSTPSTNMQHMGH